MSQFQDTVREELVDILDKLQEIYRRSNPNSVLLFATNNPDDQIRSLTAQDVAREISLLAPKTGSEFRCYDAYGHNFKTENQHFGELITTARMGLIDLGYKDIADTSRKLKFRMKVGFGSRVMDYELEGSDGVYRSHFQKSMVISALEQIFR